MLGSGERECRPCRWPGWLCVREEARAAGKARLAVSLQGNLCDVLMCHDGDWETLMTSILLSGLEFWTVRLSILPNYLEQNRLDLGHHPHCLVLKQFTSRGSPMR